MEGDECGRDVVNLGHVDELEPPALLGEAVGAQVAGPARPRRERRVLGRADDEHGLAPAAREWDDSDRKGRLVVLELELGERRRLDRVHHADARRPLTGICPWPTKELRRKVERLRILEQSESMSVDGESAGENGEETNVLSRDALQRRGRVGAMIRLDNIEDLTCRVRDKAARGVGEGRDVLLELDAKLGDGEDARRGRERRGDG